MSAVPTYTSVHRSAIDELLEGYVSWREACRAVWRAYEQWIGSDPGERALTYAAYLAALDGEERVACTYAHHTARVARFST
jgi:DNA-binding SARP family transcriptional activator